MKTRTSHRATAAESDRKPVAGLSRRQVLQTALAGSIAASACFTGSDASARTDRQVPTDPLEEILSRYGSEFGDLDRIV